MTLDELKSLRRGDVVEWQERPTDPKCLGLVRKVVTGGEQGVWIRWEGGDLCGPYRTESDATMLKIIPKVAREPEPKPKLVWRKPGYYWARWSAIGPSETFIVWIFSEGRMVRHTWDERFEYFIERAELLSKEPLTPPGVTE